MRTEFSLAEMAAEISVRALAAGTPGAPVNNLWKSASSPTSLLTLAARRLSKPVALAKTTELSAFHGGPAANPHKYRGSGAIESITPSMFLAISFWENTPQNT